MILSTKGARSLHSTLINLFPLMSKGESSLVFGAKCLERSLVCLQMCLQVVVTKHQSVCHQVQRERLLALWYKCFPWWQLTYMIPRNDSVMYDGNSQCNRSIQRKQQRITDQTLEIEEREWFKKYTLVHFLQATYTHRLIEQKERICIHTLS